LLLTLALCAVGVTVVGVPVTPTVAAAMANDADDAASDRDAGSKPLTQRDTADETSEQSPRDRMRRAAAERLLERRLAELDAGRQELAELLEAVQNAEGLTAEQAGELRRRLRAAFDARADETNEHDRPRRDAERPVRDRLAPADPDSRRAGEPGMLPDARPIEPLPGDTTGTVLDDEQRQLVLSFLAAARPMMHQRLMQARERDPDAARRVFREHGPRLLDIARQWRDDPERFALRRAVAEAQLEVMRVARDVVQHHRRQEADNASENDDDAADDERFAASLRDALRGPVRAQLEARLRLAVHDLERARRQVEEQTERLETALDQAERLVDERVDWVVDAVRALDAGELPAVEPELESLLLGPSDRRPGPLGIGDRRRPRYHRTDQRR
jgi:hypothetical protein